MALYNVVAGTRFYIGGTISDQPTDFVSGDFSSQVWTEVDGFRQMGDLGEQPNTITTSLINRNRDKMMKGMPDAMREMALRPRPIEMRPIDPTGFMGGGKKASVQDVWFRATQPKFCRNSRNVLYW